MNGWSDVNGLDMQSPEDRRVIYCFYSLHEFICFYVSEFMLLIKCVLYHIFDCYFIVFVVSVNCINCLYVLSMIICIVNDYM